MTRSDSSPTPGREAAANAGRLSQQSGRGAAVSVLVRYAAKTINLVSIAILARMLAQGEFGIAAAAFAIIGLLEVPGLGFGAALVALGNPVRARATAFWMSLGLGTALGLTFFAAAPLIGAWIGEDDVTAAVRLLAFTFPLVGLAAVPEGVLLGQLRFGRMYVPDVAMALVKASTAVLLALLDFGVFALVVGQLAGTATRLVLVWWPTLSYFRPSLDFDASVARRLARYAVNIVSIHLLGTWMLNIDYLLVGHYLGTAALGVYSVAFRLPEMTVKELVGGVSRVLFPVYTRLRDDRKALGVALLQTTAYTSAITIPMAIGLALVADPAVAVVFGSDWALAAEVLPTLAVYMMVRSLYFNVGAIYKAIDRTATLTAINLASAAVLTPILWWTAASFGTLTAIANAHVVLAIAFGLAQLTMMSRLLGIGPSSLLAAYAPACAATGAMAAAVVAVRTVVAGQGVADLVAGVATGALVYGSIMVTFQRSTVRRAAEALGLRKSEVS